MSTNVAMLNTVWNVDHLGRDLSISMTKCRSNSTSIIAITETGGIGSVFDANSLGVDCYLGSRGNGIPEAFARSLPTVLKSEHVLLTLALREIDSEVVQALIGSIRSRSDSLK
jgi:hypothetical protein